jgi:hypothetical protein
MSPHIVDEKHACAGSLRLRQPAGIIAALGLFGWSLAGIADIDRQIEADAAKRERHDRTTVFVAQAHAPCDLVRPVAVRRSARDA